MGVAVVLNDEEQGEYFAIREDLAKKRRRPGQRVQNHHPSLLRATTSRASVSPRKSAKGKHNSTRTSSRSIPSTLSGYDATPQRCSPIQSLPQTNPSSSLSWAPGLSICDCVDELMELFDCQYFPHHSQVRRGPRRRLVRESARIPRASGADEHVNMEVAMRRKGVDWILRQLACDRMTQTKAEIPDVDAQPNVRALFKT